MTKDFKSKAKAIDKNLTIPGRTGHDHGYRKTVEHLPDYLKSNVNKKFLDGTLDQLVSNGSAVRVNAHYGSRKGLVNNGVDLYYDANSTLKNQYQFEPAITSDYKGVDEPDLHITYDDIINKLKIDLEVNDTETFDPNRSFNTDNFVWRPPIDENKFINYNLYYWFEAGLPTIEIDGSFNPATEIVGKSYYTYTSGTKKIALQNGMKIKFGATITAAHPEHTGKFYIVEGVTDSILLIDLSITPWIGTYTFDASIDPTEQAYWDLIDYDTGSNVANIKEYIVMQRGATDKNIWSRINQWYHIDTINDILQFNSQSIALDVMENRKARRPIIEFERNIQLYKHGDFSRAPITYTTSTVNDPRNFIGTTSVIIDGITFANDEIILFTNVTEGSAIPTHNDRIFKIGGVGTSVTLTEITDSRDGTGTPSLGETVVVIGRDATNTVLTNQGKEFYYGMSITKAGAVTGPFWLEAQAKTTTNSPPLFELYADNVDLVTNVVTLNEQLSNYANHKNSTFEGNKIFSYVEGTRTDVELGFKTKYGITETDNLLNKNYQNLVFNWDLGTERYVHGDLPSQTKIEGYYYFYNHGYEEYDNGWKKSNARLHVTKNIKIADETSLSVDLVDIYGITNVPEYFVTWDDTKFTWYLKEANGGLTRIHPMHGNNPNVFITQKQDHKIEFHHPTESLVIHHPDGTTTTITDSTVTITPADTDFVYGYRNSTSTATGKLYALDDNTSLDLDLNQRSGDYYPKVYYNGKLAIPEIDWKLTGSTITLPVTEDACLEDPRQIITALSENDIIDIKWHTYNASEERYDVGNQIQANPLNAEPANISFHEIFDHFGEIILNSKGMFGELSHPGIGITPGSDGRATHHIIKQNVQGKIHQQIFPAILNAFLLTDNNYDTVNSIRYVADEWERFRNKFINTVKKVVDTSPTGTTVRDIVDNTLTQLNAGKNSSFIFAHSHMAFYANYKDSTYTADGILVDFSHGGVTVVNEYTNHVYVYVDDVLQRGHGIEYTLKDSVVTFSTAPASGSTVLVRTVSSDSVSYIPTSLQKNGLWAIYKPELTGGNILTHDGIKFPAIGITDVDNAILELENRIYSNIADEHFHQGDSTLIELLHEDYYDIIPGAKRSTWASRDDWNDIQEDRFNSWAHENNVSISNTAFKNTNYTAGDPLTHNYSSLGIPGHIRGVYQWFYDTKTPDTTPWEMLGYVQKPEWWDTHYTWLDTANGGDDAKRIAMISALKFGMKGVPGSLVQVEQRIRSGFITPVGVDGVLLDPVTIGLVTAPSAIDAQANFKFGDLSDVELLWWNDEKYAWATLETLIKFRPIDLFKLKWNITDTIIIKEEYLNNVTLKRVRPADLEVHLESKPGDDPEDCRFTTVANVLHQRSGINNLLIENVHNVNVTEPIDFIKYVEALNVRLSFKLEGYTDKNSTRLLVDTLGVTNEKFVPEEDFHVHFYRSTPLKQVGISGVRVIFNGTGFEVHGGDTILSSFNVTESNKMGSSQTVEILNTSPTVTVTKYLTTTGTILKIPYGTEYIRIEDVYDFLINLGRYYESIGVVYKTYDPDGTEGYNDWNKAASDFVAWAKSKTVIVGGDEVYLSPHSKELIFRDANKRFIDHAVSKVNEVFNIADKNGNRINSKYIDVNRLDDISQGDTPATREYECVITTIEANTELFFVRLNVIEYDHVITVNRYTVFADIIYDTLLSLRLDRIKFIGQKTGDWTGLPKGAGYVVTSNKLIPNFEKTINDIDRGYFSTEETVLNQALIDASRATLGYNTKEYLKDLLYNKDVAFEFWKGLIHKAGTPSVNTNIGRSTDINSAEANVTVDEEWMFKLADAGATEKNLVYEFQLNTDEVNLEPQLIEFPLDDTPLNMETGKLVTGITTSFGHITQDEILFDEKVTLSSSDPRWVYKPTDRIEFPVLTDDEYNAANLYWPGLPLLNETTNQTVYERDLDTLYESSKFELDSYNKFNDYFTGDIVRHEGKVYTAQTDIKGSASNTFTASQWTVTAEPYRPVYWIAKKTIAGGEFPKYSGGQPMVYKAFDTNINVANIGRGITTTDKVEITAAAAHNLIVGDYFILLGTTTRPNTDGIFKVDSLAADISSTPEDESTTVFYIDSYTDTNTLFGKVLPLMPVMFDTWALMEATKTDLRYNWQVGDIAYTIDTAYKWNGSAFEVLRRSWVGYHKTSRVNTKYFNNTNKIYNPKTKQQLLKFETFDPIKGVIPGIAEREIDIIELSDTAVYTFSTDRSGNVDDRNFWEEHKVGTTWWDISTAIYIDYEQSTNIYRRNNWGKLFPGASIDVYEWVESPVEPSTWATSTGTTVDGIAISGTPYTFINEDEETVYRYSTKQKSILTGTEHPDIRSSHDSDPFQAKTFYYFWVKGKTSLPNNVVSVGSPVHRNLSVATIANYIESPATFGLPWIAPIEEHAMIMSGFGDVFNDKDAIFQLRFGEEQEVHSEFVLITENDDRDTIPEFFHGRMRDSLTTFARTKETLSYTAWTPSTAYSAGSVVVNASIYYKATTNITSAATFDATKWSRLYNITDVNTTASTLVEYRYGNVPDLTLHKLNQFGNRVRPAQSWYEDITTARRIFIEKANMLLKEINLIDSIVDWDKTIGTIITRGGVSYNLADYWNYVDWIDSSYTEQVPDKDIADRKTLKDEPVVLNNIIRVLDDGTSRYEIYRGESTGWVLVQKENATIELSCKLWDGYLDCGGWDICTWAGKIAWDKFPEFELFQIIDALRNDIFISEFKYAYNKLFFTMIDQALVDQVQIDWAFKTTYIQLKVNTNLAIKVNLYKPEVSDYIVDYIKDVKPYHTKLRDVFHVKDYTDLACITVTDSSTKKIIIKFERTGCGWDDPVIQNPWDTFDWDLGRTGRCETWCKDLIDGGDCFGITEPGWDNGCRGWDSHAYDITDRSVLEDLYVDLIYNASTFGLDPATIEFILESGQFIQPNNTCFPEELVPVTTYDAVDIRVQTNTDGSTVDPMTRTFQMFKDAIDYFHIHRVDDTNGKTTSTSSVQQLATEIEVTHPEALTNLTQPDVENNVPGVIWMDTERMEFWGISVGTGTGGTDVLTGVTRGTYGTSAIAHAPNTRVIDGGRRQQIPGIPDYWDYLNNIDSSVPARFHTHTAFNDLSVVLQASTNAEANFINATTGTNW